MQQLRRRVFVVFLLTLSFSSLAYAGDAATIVLSSGATVSINNGYTQLATELKEFNRVNRKGGESYIAEINIEGNTFYINLRDVALICRDTCGSITIKSPKKE